MQHASLKSCDERSEKIYKCEKIWNENIINGDFILKTRIQDLIKIKIYIYISFTEQYTQGNIICGVEAI